MQDTPTHATLAQLPQDPARATVVESANAVILRLTAAQRGLVHRPQLLAAGLTARVVEGRVRSGMLQRVRRGVYRVGALPQPREREVAALLACGPMARLSFSSAAAMHGLAMGAGGGPVEVTVSTGHRRSDAGMRVHRAPAEADEVTAVEGLPVTTVARTVLDLVSRRHSDTIPPTDPERLLAAALRIEPALAADLLHLFARYPGHVGTARLKPWLAGAEDAPFTRSEAEALFLEILREAGLPLPRCNVRILGMEVDCFWKEYGLVAEIDGYSVHSSRTAFENDRQRDARLAAAGFRMLRFTWRQLKTRRVQVAEQVGQAMAYARPA